MDIQAKVAELQAAMRAKGHERAVAWSMIYPNRYVIMMEASEAGVKEEPFNPNSYVKTNYFHVSHTDFAEAVSLAEKAIADMAPALARGYARELGEVS